MLRRDWFMQRHTLMIALTAAAIIFILWNIPALNGVLYPFRLFVTFVHETGHGLAALVSGGRFTDIVLETNGGGYSETLGGSPALILPAGYIGTALFGAAVFYLTNQLPNPRGVALGVAVLLALVTLLYTETGSLAFNVGMGIALILGAIWWLARLEVVLLALDFLAIITGLNAVLDVVNLTQYASFDGGRIRNDAAAYSATVAPNIEANTWAYIWAGVAITLVGAAVYFSLFKPQAVSYQRQAVRKAVSRKPQAAKKRTAAGNTKAGVKTASGKSQAARKRTPARSVQAGAKRTASAAAGKAAKKRTSAGSAKAGVKAKSTGTTKRAAKPAGKSTTTAGTTRRTAAATVSTIMEQAQAASSRGMDYLRMGE